jgi:probable HAF family extracellular repeat protein
VLWQDGTATDLGTFDGPQACTAAISNLGQAAGWAQTNTGADRGFLSSDGKMTDLGLNFFPAAVNDNGQDRRRRLRRRHQPGPRPAAQPELTLPPEGYRMTGGLQPSHKEGKMTLSTRRPNTRTDDHQHASRRAGRAVNLMPALAAGVTLMITAAACSSSSSSASSPAHTSAPARSASAPASSAAAMSTLGAHSLPAQTSQTLPAFPAFYDAHKDVVVVSDAYPKAAAGTFHANYAPSLSAVLPDSQPAWYIVRGPAAPGQLVVLGSEPGESDYSPLWRTVIVRWKPGVTPQVLTSDNMILDLAKKGQLTATKTAMVVNSTVTEVKGTPTSSAAAPASRLGAGSLPAQTRQTLPAFPAFYDAHKDVVVVSDAYPKAAAGTFHANYAPSLGAVKPGSQPAWYVVRGPAAPGQIAVLGSEPGEGDYSPLWRTVIVRWKPGVTPQVLTSDNMILDLAKKGQLTATKTAVIVNATVIPKS